VEKLLPILVFEEHESVVQVKLIKFRFSEPELKSIKGYLRIFANIYKIIKTF